mgnify:CR=1 FL=1
MYTRGHEKSRTSPLTESLWTKGALVGASWIVCGWAEMWNAEVNFRPLIIILNRSVRRWSSQLLCVSHNVDRGEAILYPIENQKQHCCVHDMIQNDKIKQLVSLGSLGDVTDVFALLCDWTVTNAQKYLTNQTSIPNQHLRPLRGPLLQTTQDVYLLSMYIRTVLPTSSWFLF